jgi:hypothetical protein
MCFMSEFIGHRAVHVGHKTEFLLSFGKQILGLAQGLLDRQNSKVMIL